MLKSQKCLVSSLKESSVWCPDVTFFFLLQETQQADPVSVID